MVDAWLVRGWKTDAEKARECLMAAARRRVERSPRMRKYAAIIMSDGYADSDDHLRWVFRAPVREIELWAQQIKEDSDG